MKTFAKYHNEYNLFYFPIFVGFGFLAAFVDYWSPLLSWVSWLFLIALLAIFLLPFKKYSNSLAKSSCFDYVKTFLKITILQCFLLLIAINLDIVFNKFLPVNATMNYSQSLLVSQQDFINNGFFPWTVVVLLAVITLLYEKYYKNIMSLNQLTQPFVNPQVNKLLSVGIDLFFRQALIIGICLVLLLLGLSFYFYAVIFGLTSKIDFSPNGYTIFAYLLIFILFSTRFWTRFIRRLTWRGFSTLQLLLLQTITTILLFILLLVALRWFSQAIAVDFSQAVVFPMPKLSYVNAWELLKWCLWLSLSIYLVPKLHRMLQGKSIRTSINLCLFWPFVYAIFVVVPGTHNSLIAIIHGLANPWMIVLLNVLFLLLVIVFCIYNKDFEKLLKIYFYQHKAEQQKFYPLKMRSNFLRLISVLILLYFFNGINLLTILLFALVGFCMIIFLAIVMGVFKLKWLNAV